MSRIRISRDPEECERLWDQLWPSDQLFDLWPVRSAFAAAYDRTPFFVVAEEKNRPVGLLALAEIDSSGCYGFFPAETWRERTWLEQNRIFSPNREVFREMLAAVPGSVQLRYMTRETLSLLPSPFTVDEVGFLFVPAEVDFSYENYLRRFSGKSRKKLGRELDGLEKQGLMFRLNHLEDVELVFRINRERFGEASYFADPRFTGAFASLVGWLHENNMLRLTTVLLGGRIAAIDIGALWRNNYTLLAGCTSVDFPGVAKLINLHHIRRACEEKMGCADFLCGDFNWKKRFHLTERPLFKPAAVADRIEPPREGRNEAFACVHDQ